MTRHRARGASAVVAGALLSVLLGACTTTEAPVGTQVPGVRSSVRLLPPEDRPAAPLEVEAPLLGSDDTIALEQLVGEVVVLNFWGSWCGPCRKEQPELNDAAAALGDEPVAFLGVNVDDSTANAAAHEREFDIPYPSVFDPDFEYTSEFGVAGARSIPTTVVLDPEGRVAFQLFGETDAAEVLAAVDAVLDDAEAASRADAEAASPVDDAAA